MDEQYVTTLAARLREARERAGVTQHEARAAIGVSQATYSRIENGERPLKGHELIQLADRFGMRVAAITNLPEVRERARFAARTDGTTAPMNAMRDKLISYLELDSYLTEQGYARA